MAQGSQNQQTFRKLPVFDHHIDRFPFMRASLFHTKLEKLTWSCANFTTRNGAHLRKLSFNHPCLSTNGQRWVITLDVISFHQCTAGLERSTLNHFKGSVVCSGLSVAIGHFLYRQRSQTSPTPHPPRFENCLDDSTSLKNRSSKNWSLQGEIFNR